MRSKDEILEVCKADISNERYKAEAPLWLEVRKIELLLDIREILEGVLGFLATYYEDGLIHK